MCNAQLKMLKRAQKEGTTLNRILKEQENKRS